MIGRWIATAAAAWLALGLGASAATAAEALKEFRIGYQKNGVLVVAKQQGALEKRLAPLGVTVTWTEFSFGPPILEAINTGSLDFGATGDVPPVFAQAARADLVYVAAYPGSAAAVVVPQGSPLKTLADLKGRRVGFAKGSSAQNLTLAALEKAGLTYADITPVYLAPADAAAAFAQGSIDAWTIWDPYFAIAETTQNARVLERSEAITPQNAFYLARRAIAEEHPEIVAAVVDELAKTADWANGHRDELARIFSEITGVDLAVQRVAVERATFSVGPVTGEVVASQQRLADRFRGLGILPRDIVVKDIVWRRPAS